MNDDALGREIRQLREDLKDRLPREVYAAEWRAIDSRLRAVERDIELGEQARVATRRWQVGSVVLPVMAMVVMIVMTLVRT